MKQLRHNGRYHIALSGYEYVARYAQEDMQTRGVYALLTAPPDTAYPNAPNLVVMADGSIQSNEGKLSITIADLDFSGRYHDFATNHASPASTSIRDSSS